MLSCTIITIDSSHRSIGGINKIETEYSYKITKVPEKLLCAVFHDEGADGRDSTVFARAFLENLIFVPAAGIPQLSQNDHLRRGYGGDSNDNLERKNGQFLKNPENGLHRQTDFPIHKRLDIDCSVLCLRERLHTVYRCRKRSEKIAVV